jgi:hypothetical protein
MKIDSKRSMFILIFSAPGMLPLDKSPKRCKMNSQYLCDVVLEEAKHSVTAITEDSGLEGMMIPMDNRDVHKSARTTQRLEELHVIWLAHPPECHDISPCGFRVFGWSKDMMKGHQFQSADNCRVFLIELWFDFDQSTLISVSQGWIARLDEVIPTNGGYYSI